MKQEIAQVSGWDEGNRSMRNGGRTAWSTEDYNAAVKKFNDISNSDYKKTDRRVK